MSVAPKEYAYTEITRGEAVCLFLHGTNFAITTNGNEPTVHNNTIVIPRNWIADYENKHQALYEWEEAYSVYERESRIRFFKIS